MYPAQDTYPAARSGYDFCTEIDHPLPLVARNPSSKCFPWRVQRQATC